MQKHYQRNWSQYNQRLKKVASVDFFISKSAIGNWYYKGARRPGGKRLYSDYVIEACLMLREHFSLPLRQTQGFVSSVLRLSKIDSLRAPDYSTLSRRCRQLRIKFPQRNSGSGLVIAIDSTGLTVYDSQAWHRLKHKKGERPYHEKWRKLHVAINVEDGSILGASCTDSRRHDCQEFPKLVEMIDAPVEAVCGDMAYDTVNCREAVRRKKAKQLIPPRRDAAISPSRTKKNPALKERDQAIEYIRKHTIDNDLSTARSLWKEKTGYHQRSLVETTMSQIKAHTSDKITNRNEENRINQALIKCKVINKIIAA